MPAPPAMKADVCVFYGLQNNSHSERMIFARFNFSLR
jgi:hypothetical protein